MPESHVVINAFNEARLLPMALASLPPGVPVTVFDGAYASFPHEVPWSTDGTCELAEDWGANVVRVTEPWPDQITKRTAMLRVAPVVFVLDADEVLRGWADLPDEADIGWITIESPLYADPYDEPRVFRVREGWHYAGRHHWIYDEHEQLVTSHRKEGGDYSHHRLPITCSNHRDWRDAERSEAKATYSAPTSSAAICCRAWCGGHVPASPSVSSPF